MKILVTGGAGFIGSNVVDGYVKEGHDVIIVDNLFTGKKENLNPDARFYHVDVRSDELYKVFENEKPDIINHHAAQISVPASVEDPSFDADVNIIGLINLLECSIKYGIEKFIFISSGGAIYGETDIIPTPETFTPLPLSPYAITKLGSENYLAFYKHQYNLNYTVLRYANIYGPRQVPHGEAGVVAIFMNKLMADEIPTIYHYPEEPDGMKRDYCFVDDIVRVNILALSIADNEAVNIGTEKETTTGELYRIILETIREKGFAINKKFDFPNKGSARSGDLKKSCLSISKVQELLGWFPEYDLKRGISKTLDWYLTNK